MEKIARKPSADPVQERLRANKAAWNKDVSTFINDLIHIKKTINGWPSKFFKERSRITQPIPADPGTVIGALAGDFQEIVNRGNGIIQEQLDYAKNRRQKPQKPVVAPGQTPPPANDTAAPAAPGNSDLSQQMGKQLAASLNDSELIKVAFRLESKYELETLASNPFSRFITRLFNPKFGFGEGARIRRLRMAMLDNCVKSYKELKKLHKEIVKSSKNSIVVSHKMMTQIWNYWNAVNRLFSTYKAIRPSDLIKDQGGQIETDPELKKEKAIEEGREADENQEIKPTATPSSPSLAKITDYRAASASLGVVASNPAFRELGSVIDGILAAPKDKMFDVFQKSNIDAVYDKALQETNTQLGTNGNNFVQVVAQLKAKLPAKEAQRQLGKFRHQVLPGATSGQRLEIYQFITQIRKDLNEVMNLLESGFDQEKLVAALGQVNREMSSLRIMLRSLYHSEKPEEASTFLF
jgi:hypothetical protein